MSKTDGLNLESGFLNRRIYHVITSLRNLTYAIFGKGYRISLELQASNGHPNTSSEEKGLTSTFYRHINKLLRVIVMIFHLEHHLNKLVTESSVTLFVVSLIGPSLNQLYRIKLESLRLFFT